MGTGRSRVEHFGHARASIERTRRSNCAQGSRGHDARDGAPFFPVGPPWAPFSAAGAAVASVPCQSRGVGGGGRSLRSRLRFAKTPCYADIETMLRWHPAALSSGGIPQR